MGISARKFLGVGTRLLVWGAIGITFQGDGRHHGREFGTPFLQVVIFGATSGESESPAIVMNHDCDMIRLSKEAALRTNVASSKCHFGDAICQTSFEKSCRYLS